MMSSLMRYFCLTVLTSIVCANAGQPAPTPKPQPAAGATPGQPAALPVAESELARIPRIMSDTFPWKRNVQPPPPPPKNAAATQPDDNAFGDVTSGEIIIKAAGNFTREVKSLTNADGVAEDKEILTLTKDVEIEQLTVKSVLRGQHIKVIRDLKTGMTELLEAHGDVQIVTPERKGRGEVLIYETKIGPQGNVLKDLYTIEGDRVKGTRATLWQGDDIIEAERFINDRRLDIFRVQGGPVAIVTVPKDPNAPPPKPAPAGGGMLPGFGVTGGNKIRMKADGEMFYEGAVGRVRITRNVTIQQEGPDKQIVMTMVADDAVLTLSLPPPGQPPQADSGSVFSGSLKGMDCNGRVEIRTPSQVVLCDKGALDMAKNTFVMEMKNPKEEVRIFIKESPAGGKVLVAPKSFVINMETSEFHSAGPLRMEAYTGNPPSNRNKEDEKPKPKDLSKDAAVKDKEAQKPK